MLILVGTHGMSLGKSIVVIYVFLEVMFFLPARGVRQKTPSGFLPVAISNPILLIDYISCEVDPFSLCDTCLIVVGGCSTTMERLGV
jgi:hypothetical protein